MLQKHDIFPLTDGGQIVMQEHLPTIWANFGG
jgi:hypothetical protein